jgi:hypothetical protein
MATVTIIVVKVASLRLLRVEAQFGVRLAALDVATC